MGYVVVFDGTDSYGAFDSTVSFTNTQSMSFRFQAEAADQVTDFTVFSDSANTDAVKFGSSTNNTVFQVKIGGTSYSSGTGITTELFDGVWHDVVISRSGSNITLNIDGVDKATVSASTGNIDIDLVAIGGTAGTEYGFWLEDNLVIGSETWAMDGTDTVDSTPSANTLTLTDTQVGLLSTWEWVGDIVDIQKTYIPVGGTQVTEYRREGTRRRIVKGFSASEPRIKQLGDAEDSVTAYNGTQATTIGPVDNVAQIPCEEENFSTLAGPEFFYQIQRWVSWDND